jgi:uncharacterized membrane protein
VIVTGYAVGVAAFAFLPGAYVPPAWGWAARIALAALLPTVATVTAWAVTSSFGTVHDATAAASAKAVRAILFATTLFIVTLHIVMLTILLGGTFGVPPARIVLALFGVLLMVVGNGLPRVRPNLAFGVRTRALLGNATGWARIHRAMGHLVVAMGLTMVCVAFLLRGRAIEVALVTAMVVMAAAGMKSYREVSRA